MRWTLLLFALLIGCDRGKPVAPAAPELPATQLRDLGRLNEAAAAYDARDDVDAALGALEIAALRGDREQLAAVRARLADADLDGTQLGVATVLIARAGAPGDALTARACEGDTHDAHRELSQACAVLGVLGANTAAQCVVGCDTPQTVGFYPMTTPAVLARVNGQKPMLFALMSTGPAVFTPSAAADLGFGDVATRFDRDGVSARVATATVALGGTSIEHVPFIEENLRNDAIAGALPLDLLFADRAVELDYPRGTLTIGAPVGEHDFVTAPLARSNGFITWTSIGARAPAPALIDLSAMRLILTAAYDATGAPLPQLREVPHRCPTGSCRGALVSPMTTPVEIGDAKLHYPYAVIEPDTASDALLQRAVQLGSSGLSDRIVRFDLPNNTFHVSREPQLPPLSVGDAATFRISGSAVQAALLRETVVANTPEYLELRQEIESGEHTATFHVRVAQTSVERGAYLHTRTPVATLVDADTPIAVQEYTRAVQPFAAQYRSGPLKSSGTADWRIDGQTRRCAEARHDVELADQRRGSLELVQCANAGWHVVLSRLVAEDGEVAYEYRRDGAEALRGEIQ